MPLAIVGTDEMVPIEYTLPVASAQVKSCHPARRPQHRRRDHGDRARGHARPHRAHAAPFRRRGAAWRRPTAAGKRITVVGWPELKARDIVVPGDPSSAAFAVVAAAVTAGQRRDWSRMSASIRCAPASIATLQEMGADITFENEREVGGEPVADLHVRAAR